MNYQIMFYTPPLNKSDSIPHMIEHLQSRMLENSDLGFGDRRYDGRAFMNQCFTVYPIQGSGSDAVSALQFLSNYCDISKYETEIKVLVDEYNDLLPGSILKQKIYESIGEPANYSAFEAPSINELKTYHKKWYQLGSKAIIDETGKIVYFEGGQSPGLSGSNLKQNSSFEYRDTKFAVHIRGCNNIKQWVTLIILSDYYDLILSKQAHQVGKYHHFDSRNRYLGSRFGLVTPLYDRFTFNDSYRNLVYERIYKSGQFERGTHIGYISLILGRIVTRDEVYEIIDSLTFEDIKHMVGF